MGAPEAGQGPAGPWFAWAELPRASSCCPARMHIPRQSPSRKKQKALSGLHRRSRQLGVPTPCKPPSLHSGPWAGKRRVLFFPQIQLWRCPLTPTSPRKVSSSWVWESQPMECLEREGQCPSSTWHHSWALVSARGCMWLWVRAGQWEVVDIEQCSSRFASWGILGVEHIS